MGPIIIILVILYLVSRNKKKHRRTHYSGKSNWEKTCDDGGKFFNW